MGQHEHSFRNLFNGLCYVIKTSTPCAACRTISGLRAGDLAHVDQSRARARVAGATKTHGVEPKAVMLAEPRRGFVLLPRRRAVERPFG